LDGRRSLHFCTAAVGRVIGDRRPAIARSNDGYPGGKLFFCWLEFFSAQTVSKLSAQESKFRMKKIDMENDGLWPTPERLEKARRELHKKISEEIVSSLRREAVEALIALLKIDRERLRTLWIQPLLNAGATVDMALACIAQSEFQPN